MTHITFEGHSIRFNIVLTWTIFQVLITLIDKSMATESGDLTTNPIMRLKNYS